MARRIDSAITGPFVLSLSDPLAPGGSDDPLIISSTGMITSAGDAIDGAAGTDWKIINHGTVEGEISLAGAGFLDNSGLISGGFTTGSFGKVTNMDAITGYIDLGGDGVVINRGTMSAVEIGGSGTVTNRGTMDSIITYGVYIAGEGVVNNDGLMDVDPGVIIGGGGTVTNRGSIEAYGVAILIDNGGVVTNLGLIRGSHGPTVEINDAPGTVTNKGWIEGGNSGAVRLSAGGTVTNLGTMTGEGGVVIEGGGDVTNDGSIGLPVIPGPVFGDGVAISGGGNVINTGLILAYDDGIEISGGSGTVENAGTIGSTYSFSVLFDPTTSNNRLIIDPGAVFNGAAEATGGTNSTIELTKGIGTISGIGDGQFIGFDTLDADAGAKWTLSGPNSIGAVLNDGSLSLSGSLDVSTAVDPDSTGIFQLVGASTLEVAAALGTNMKIGFDTGSDLVVDDFGLFGTNVGAANYVGPLLKNFGGATVDLANFNPAGLNMSLSKSGVLRLTDSASRIATLDFQVTSLGAGTFHFQSDGGTGVLITHS